MKISEKLEDFWDDFLDAVSEYQRHRRHHRNLFVFFFGEGVNTMNITSILTTDTTKGAFVAIAETDANGNPVSSSGPFAITVSDPSNVAKVTPGSPDNTTPTRIVANGSNNVGSVSVSVTDKSNNAVGTASLSVAAPPPPPPTPTLTVTFVPGT
jgi:hypothetical protein